MPTREVTLKDKIKYHFKDASFGCGVNTALSVLEGRIGDLTPVHPWILQIEVSNRCNLNCITCARHNNELQLGDLDPALFDEIVELSKKVQEVALFGYGEPLMAKAFWTLLPRLESTHVGFFTNGMLLTGQMFRKVLAAAKPKISYVVFSIDGAKQETYERIRCEGKHETVWKNLKEVQAVRKKLGLDIVLRLEFTAMASNVEELPLLVEQAEEAGVDFIKVSHLVVQDETMQAESLFFNPSLCRKAFDAAKNACEGKHVQIDLPKYMGLPFNAEKPLPPCRMPWHYAMISCEGDIRACCFAHERTMGNLKHNTFDDIWHSEHYQNLRRNLKGEGLGPQECQECEERFRSHPSPSDRATYLKLQPRKK